MTTGEIDTLTAIELLKYLRDIGHCPLSNEGKTPFTPPSNSELKRWLDKKCVWCNGQPLKPDSVVSFPITQLVFNWKGKSKCTVIWEDSLEAYNAMLDQR